MGEPGVRQVEPDQVLGASGSTACTGDPLADDHRPERRVPRAGRAARDDRGAPRPRRRPSGSTRSKSPTGSAGRQLARRTGTCRRRCSTSLAATQLARPLTPLERKVLRTVVDIVTGRREHSAPPTLLDVLALLEAPDRRAVRRRPTHATSFVRDVEEVRFALDELCTGPLRGMFDGPSTVNVDWDGPGLVMDLSGVVDDARAMAAGDGRRDRLVPPATPPPRRPATDQRQRRELLHVQAGRDRRVRPGAPQTRPPTTAKRTSTSATARPTSPPRPTTAPRSPRWPTGCWRTRR